MAREQDSAQPSRSEGQWPTCPAPPGSAPMGGRALIGISYLTTEAIWVATLVQASCPLQSAT
jgi:hypothetical protein